MNLGEFANEFTGKENKKIKKIKKKITKENSLKKICLGY